MNVLLVSQCNKNALKETRRILDQFAERRGERTWQTSITQAGLDMLRKLLRQSARRNTAVACHWIRGRDRSELLWIVGNASRFNLRGAVPTNTTARDVLRRGDENDWHTGEDIRLLSSLAALLHDLGKACVAFQQRLTAHGNLSRNQYRHEWISLRLFQAFVGNDDDRGWLERLKDLPADDDQAWTAALLKDGLVEGLESPFRTLPPLAAAVGWLVLTHHRLPLLPDDDGRPTGRVTGFRAERLTGLPEIITPNWNECPSETAPTVLQPYWRFDYPLPVTTSKWRGRARNLAERLLGRLPSMPAAWLDNPYVMHLARMSLMLADHHYSSLTDPKDRVKGEPGYGLYANTNRATRQLNQPLDEHLIGVEAIARAITRSLPGLERHLPRLARHKGFRKRTADPRFQWQNSAFDLAASLRERTTAQGFFGVNMASTGRGKTLANGRILYALANPEQGARFSIALGLRTLTLQTGQAFRELMHLGDDELAIRVGGTANRILFEHFEEQAERHGSASAQDLMDEDGHVFYEGDFGNHPVLKHLRHDPAIRSLIAAPILACTVDHLTPATESVRGGRQIAPMLRLMSSDLVLDEIDDFALEDLPALTRLVHWAGMLGSRVLLSSATLAPALVEGLFLAYREGRAVFQRNRGEPGQPVNIVCAWFDEYGKLAQDCADGPELAAAHGRFVQGRQKRLAAEQPRRSAELASLPISRTGSQEEIRQEYARQLRGHALELHRRHCSVDPASGKRVSFGLIRMANIEPLIAVAQTLFRDGAPEGHRFHLCVYHSRFPLLMRSEIERNLDRILNRKQPEAVFELPVVRHRIDAAPEPDQLFIVIGSPVTEVGRDHDYDWAVVEPSSMRSIIQLAGRVRRHREPTDKGPNLVLPNFNLKALERRGQPAYCRPGFESEEWMLRSHDLGELLRPEEYATIDSRPRIIEPQPLEPADRLLDLEHARLRDTLLPRKVDVVAQPLSRRERRAMRSPATPRLNAASWYQLPRATLTGTLQKVQRFRDQTGQNEVDLVLMPDEAEEDWVLQKIHREPGSRGQSVYIDVEKSLMQRHNLEAVIGPRTGAWITRPYMDALAHLAEQLDMPLEHCARRFGTVSVPDRDNGWSYHDALGFFLSRNDA
ncbi:CRISPR-associated helicase Cas3 family [Thioalkalivibrio nitratireducens DSM 14787]|uniref:CRISPR-associated helicase Cas3 family n=1 Tax=Thioalkalivibrio nitratireducens (strain DSM 14787 / UNIQEM 213 / ALEN2) TaxID=1255043 RepID=L0DYG2_THIND|nr:type I-F CRISPR-associated helicase Cas3f [Thioalkalivibrio nitratireducens]AGA34093.1 CRISPR-associated helicase Cas3 family [Thioalkalivibrio nitratireducens DSM 14787]